MFGELRIAGIGKVSEIRTHSFDGGDKIATVRLEIKKRKKDGEVYTTYHSVELRGSAMDGLLGLTEGDMVSFSGAPAVKTYEKKDGTGTAYNLTTFGNIFRLSEDEDIVA
jgi:hypothetical protein